MQLRLRAIAFAVVGVLRLTAINGMKLDEEVRRGQGISTNYRSTSRDHYAAPQQSHLLSVRFALSVPAQRTQPARLPSANRQGRQ